MNQLWGSINALQMVAYFPILSLEIPPNVWPIFDSLIEVVTFDLFGIWIEDVNFGQTETEPFSNSFDRLKYDSLNILTNMFSMHIFLIFLLLQTIFYFILGMSCFKNFAMCRRY